MSGFLRWQRLDFSPADAAEADVLRDTHFPRGDPSAGIGPASRWVKVGEPWVSASLLLANSLEGILEAQRAIVEHPLYANVVARMESPADVLVLEIVGSSGMSPAEAPLGALLSLSLRSTSPGGTELYVRRMRERFEELALLHGFEGWLIAKNVAAEEQVAAMAFWGSEVDFRRSLPDVRHYEVQAYERRD